MSTSTRRSRRSRPSARAGRCGRRSRGRDRCAHRSRPRQPPPAHGDGSTLRQVAVLFVDVVGSTAIGSSLDPEDIQGLIDPMLRRFTSIITERLGRVFKYTGDGLLAAFGADESEEDHPEQAVRAGLEIIDAMREAGIDVPDDRRLRVRVGHRHRPVLVGGGVEGGQTIRGATVNMAARMEQHAPVDGLRISAATYRLVRGRFDAVEQAPIVVKGVDGPQVTYLVERARPRSFRVMSRGVEGIDTPMVGRDRRAGRAVPGVRGLRERLVVPVARRSRRCRDGKVPVALRVRALGRGPAADHR